MWRIIWLLRLSGLSRVYGSSYGLSEDSDMHDCIDQAEAASRCSPAKQTVNCLTGFLECDRRKFCQITFRPSYPNGPLLSQLFQWALCLTDRKDTSRNCPTWHVKLQLFHPLILLRHGFVGRAESQHVACFVPVSTQQRLSVWWCTARLQVELTSSLLTPAVGWTTRFCVPGVANTATPAPPSLRGAAAPSVPRLPAPVRVTSPPVPRPAHPSPGDASLVARPAVQARRMFGAGLQNRCTQVF